MIFSGLPGIDPPHGGFFCPKGANMHEHRLHRVDLQADPGRGVKPG